MNCIQCNQSYQKHMESYAAFAAGSINRTVQKQNKQLVRPKRTHSFHDFEKPHLRKLCHEELNLKYRMMKAHKEIFAQDKKVFECAICNNECEISTIAILQRCGHYYCKTCLQDYYNYMVNVSGQIEKMKCPNTECKAEIEKKDLKELLNSDTYGKFKRLLLNYEVTNSRDKKFCPYAGCERVI